MEPANLDAMLARFAEHWSPKRIAQVNNYDVRIVKVQGEFTWPKHEDTDEFFLVLGGQPTIQLRDRDVALGPRSCSSCHAGSSTARGQMRKPRCCCSSRATWSTRATRASS
jgi:mannose-6-phosphate isomerase-like protein (cupin superfamily)